MIGTSELAKKAGLSENRIRQLASEIPGAERKSFGWLFPDDADQHPPLLGTIRPSNRKPGPKGPRKGARK